MKKKTTLFTTFMESLVRTLERNGKMRTAETYRCACNSIVRYGGSSITLRNMTPAFIEGYENWLLGTGLSRNTTSFYMRILRAVYNRGIDQGYAPAADPFRHVYTGVDKTVKRAVPLHIIRKIKMMDLSDRPDLAFARDLFMFSFYTRGMSFVDMAYLRRSDLAGHVLTYSRSKTGQRLAIHWEPCMQDIVDRWPSSPAGYLLPIVQRTDKDARHQYKSCIFKVNKSLREISERLELSHPLTTYVARHSWASIAYARNIPVSVIAEGMGHDSERTTRIYLASLSNARVDRANSKIIGLL